MKRPTFKAPPYLTRPQGGRGIVRSVILAVLVHGLLGVLLFSGIRWKTKPPEPVSAEIFSPPPTVAVAPVAKPEPKLEPKVEPKPEPAKTEPKIVPAPAPKPEAKVEIDTEKASKKDKPKDTKKDEREQKEAKKEEKKLEPKKLTKDEPKAEKTRESPKKETEAKVDSKKDEVKTEDAKKDDASREDYVKSMVAKAAAAEAKNKAGTGTTVGATAPTVNAGTDRGYRSKVISALKANTSFPIPEDLQDNPEAVFLVKLKPDCGIISVEMRKSSGLGSWDRAAERSIRRTDPFPSMSNGLCDASLEIGRTPKE
jgi:colicin import membrane protein